MCGALWECIKCPGKVVCCCCKCACNMLMGFICSGLVLLIIIGLIVYFTVFYHKGGSDPETTTMATAKMTEALIAKAPESFRDYFKAMEN